MGRTYTLHKATKRYRSHVPGGSRANAQKTALHRDVYSATYGNIPHGWHVHHKDEDPHNNELDNLQAMAPLDHARLHKGQVKELSCEHCGATFTSNAINGTARYCKSHNHPDKRRF
jgi:hypothetical protein